MLFGPSFHFTQDAERILLAFDVKPDRFTRDRVRSAGFVWNETRGAYVRKLNRYGLDAAQYLKRQLEEDANART